LKTLTEWSSLQPFDFLKAAEAIVASQLIAGAACSLRMPLTVVSTLLMKAAFVGGGELRFRRVFVSGFVTATTLSKRRSKLEKRDKMKIFILYE
jgi:hypothetical protein